MTLKIASFNIKNARKKYKKNNAKVLIDIIKKEKIDLLGTQELTKEYEKVLNDNLTDYKFYGKYRFGNSIFFKNRFNENNIIITNKKVISDKTIYLPFIPNDLTSLKECIKRKTLAFPRIATVIEFLDENQDKIIMINTHIEYKIQSIKIKQLNKLKEIISKYGNKYPIILTGDFNMKEDDEAFKKFIDDLKQYNLKKIKIKENTWVGKSGKGKIIDHIFIPSKWTIISSGIIDNRKISDHYPIYVEVKINKRLR